MKKLTWFAPYKTIISGDPETTEGGHVAVWKTGDGAIPTFIPDILGPDYVKVV